MSVTSVQTHLHRNSERTSPAQRFSEADVPENRHLSSRKHQNILVRQRLGSADFDLIDRPVIYFWFRGGKDKTLCCELEIPHEVRTVITKKEGMQLQYQEAFILGKPLTALNGVTRGPYMNMCIHTCTYVYVSCRCLYSCTHEFLHLYTYVGRYR